MDKSGAYSGRICCYGAIAQMGHEKLRIVTDASACQVKTHPKPVAVTTGLEAEQKARFLPFPSTHSSRTAAFGVTAVIDRL
eukprot:1010382-Pleurochrysis_carterae.AAC.4